MMYLFYILQAVSVNPIYRCKKCEVFILGFIYAPGFDIILQIVKEESHELRKENSLKEAECAHFQHFHAGEKGPRFVYQGFVPILDYAVCDGCLHWRRCI
jgi:hypothetical protein